MSERNPFEWITAADAGKLLRLSSRQVHRYGELGKIRTKKVGRRVLFHSDDVSKLADELQVDYRPAPPPPRDLAPIYDLADQLRRRDAQYIEGQQQIDERLQRIEERLAKPPPPPRRNWLGIAAIALLVLVLIVAVVILLRLS